MKVLVAAVAVALLLGPGVGVACGTHPPALQSRINAAELAALRTLARTAARDADRILIGTVTELSRPIWKSGQSGSVTLRVDEALRGSSSATHTVRWEDSFTYSCQSSKSFHNVGFRLGGRFIVYIRAGEVFRSAAADHLRSGLLSLGEERAIAAGGGS